MRRIEHRIAGGAGGGFGAPRTAPVYDPNRGVVQAEVVLGEDAVLDRAVAAAKEAQPAWAALNPQKRRACCSPSSS